MDPDFLAMDCAAKYRDDASLLDPNGSGSILRDTYVIFVDWWAVLFKQAPAMREVRS
jgi:hypothetical protein